MPLQFAHNPTQFIDFLAKGIQVIPQTIIFVFERRRILRLLRIESLRFLERLRSQRRLLLATFELIEFLLSLCLKQKEVLAIDVILGDKRCLVFILRFYRFTNRLIQTRLNTTRRPFQFRSNLIVRRLIQTHRKNLILLTRLPS